MSIHLGGEAFWFHETSLTLGQLLTTLLTMQAVMEIQMTKLRERRPGIELIEALHIPF